jgi:hypothetical protein
VPAGAVPLGRGLAGGRVPAALVRVGRRLRRERRAVRRAARGEGDDQLAQGPQQQSERPGPPAHGLADDRDDLGRGLTGRRRPRDVELVALHPLCDLSGEDEIGIGVIDGQVEAGHRGSPSAAVALCNGRRPRRL